MFLLLGCDWLLKRVCICEAIKLHAVLRDKPYKNNYMIQLEVKYGKASLLNAT
jgi:hypothetical protein